MVQAFIVLGGPNDGLAQFPSTNEAVFIGVDRGALHLINHGIAPDLAIGDFDSITEEERENVRKHSKKFVGFQSEKDDTDTELALLHTINDFSPDSITLYNWTGGRMDHLMSILYIVLQPRFYHYIPKIRMQNQTNSLSYYLPGTHRLSKEVNKEYVSFIGMTAIKSLTLENVKYPLSHTDFNYPVALVSNEFIEEEASFSFKEGIIAVIQSADS